MWHYRERLPQGTQCSVDTPVGHDESNNFHSEIEKDRDRPAQVHMHMVCMCHAWFQGKIPSKVGHTGALFPQEHVNDVS